MDTTSHVNSLTQSNAQLQRASQTASDVDNRINALHSYLEGYVPNSGIPDTSIPSDFDASNFFNSLAADELDAHLDSHLNESFDLGPEIADESSTSSHLGAYVDEVGSASATSSPKVSSVNWNDPVLEKAECEWVNGVVGGGGGGGGGGQKRKPDTGGTMDVDDSAGVVLSEPPKKKSKVKKKKS